MRWQTTDEDGIAALFIFQLIVTDPTQPILFKVPAKYIAPYANKALLLQNTITNPGEVEVTSQLLALMFGEAAKVELLPPFLVRPAVSPIDVLAYPEGVTMRIEYLGALEGDRARLVELNAPAGAPQFPLVAFNNNKRVNTVLSPAYLAARHGKALEFRWNLNRGGGQAAKSPPLDVSVMEIADEDIRLPRPAIVQATDPEGDETLDLSTFDGSAKLTIAPWKVIAVNQKVWLRIIGTQQNDSEHSIPLLADKEIIDKETSQGLNIAVLRSELEKLKYGSSFRTELLVRFDGVDNKSGATRFPNYSCVLLNDAWTDSLTDFSNGTSNGWTIGPAGRYGYIRGGVFENPTATGASGFAGVLFSQSFSFTAGRTYSFSINLRNFSPDAANMAPIFSVDLSSGQTIMPTYTVPRTGQWIQRSADFSVNKTGAQLISIRSHQDRGSGGGSDGGNDYQIDNISVRRIT